MSESPRHPSATTVALLGLMFTVLLNVGALIWGAATLSTTVSALQGTASRLDATLQGLGGSVQDLRERLRVIEDWRVREDRPPRALP